MKNAIYTNKNITDGLPIPKPLLELSGILSEGKAAMHFCENAIVTLKGNLTAMELIQTAESLQELANRLTVQLGKVCGECHECEECQVDGWEDAERIQLPQYLLDEAGIPENAKLEAEINEDDGTITVSKSSYDNDLSDVPEDFMDILIAADICLAKLERHLMEGDVVYE